MWLSRDGRLILVKLVLEAILVYLISLAWIPRGVLERESKICFKFLWAGSQDHFFLPLCYEENISIAREKPQQI